MPPSHILFVSTSNLATNPRLVKEIELALENGYRVTALVCSFHNWSYALNEAVKQRLSGKIHLIEAVADRSSFLSWVGSTFTQKVQQLKEKLGFANAHVLSDVLIKRSILLRWKLNELKDEYHLVIAHNPGAFEPATAFAKEHGIPLGIDVEDYHPGENKDAYVISQMKKLLQKTLPLATYVSAASPLILNEIRKDCNDLVNKSLTILNYFPAHEFQKPYSRDDEVLKAVWFSQYIDEGRGLEMIVSQLAPFHEKIELHLYGQLNHEFYKKVLSGSSFIKIHDPMPQEKLHKELAYYDIGFAVEDNQANYNRSICLTNKLLAYFQAGLYILASATPAQEFFLQEHPFHGFVFSNDQLGALLTKILLQKQVIRKHALERFQNASMYNAESELKALLTIWETCN